MSKVKVQEAAKKMVDEAQALLSNVQVTKQLLGDTIERLNRLEDVRYEQEERLMEERRQAESQLKGQEPARMMSAYVMSDDEGGGFEGFVEPAGADSAQPLAEHEPSVQQAETPAADAEPEQAAVEKTAADTEEKEAGAEQVPPTEVAQPAAASAAEGSEKAARTDQPARQQPAPADRQPRQERPAAPERPRAPLADGRAMPPRPAGTGMGGTGPRPGGVPPRPGTGTGMGGTGPRAPGAQGAPGGRPFAPRDGRAPMQQGQRPFPPRDGRPAAGGTGPRPFPPRDGRPAGPGGARPGMGGGGRPGFGRQKGPELTPAQEKERVSNYDPNRSTYQRQYDPENKAQRAKKAVAKETVAAAGGLDDDFRNRKRRPSKKMALRPEPIVIEKAYMTAETITVKDLTERIGKPAGEIIKKLLLLGIMATINQELDYDTALLVCQEFGVELQLKLEKTYEETLADEGVKDKQEDLLPRPPVVTIMGHVDHGKTSLLDAVRQTNVVEGEAGGITQRIGAYTVVVNDRSITFIDTPGHEAFTSMRMRGAQATDIAVLVVAADDGIMPQTVEAINHAKAAEVPIIVAINKMDRPAANPERIKQELTNHGLVAEEWGGDTVIAEVSAVTRMGLENLLDMILLTADVRELAANPNRKARGVIIEAQLDKGRGPVATVLVQSGTLKVGDTIVAGTAYGRVRAMVDDKGKRITEAGPSTPVEVIGFSDVPEAGDAIAVVEDDRLSRQVAEERRDKQRAQQIKAATSVNLEDLFNQIAAGEVKDLNLIVKADVQGSVEAVRQSLERLSNEEVKVSVVHGSVGAISISDVMLATTAKAIIIGFNVRPDASAREMAEREKIDVRLYRVIYQAIEDIEAAMKGMLAPIFKEVVLGHAEIRLVYRISGVGAIAGCYITDGVVRRNADVRLLRDNTVVFEGKLDSLKRFKDDAREVAQGFECGIGLERYNDIKEGDVIECFINEEVPR